MHYFEDKIFTSPSNFKTGEYDNCTFKDCNFEAINIKESVFINCSFEDCNLTNQKLYNTGFKTVEFINCKLVGIDFTLCNSFLFNVYFNGCNLDFSSFYKLKLKETSFIHCSLEEVDFTEAELTKSCFNYSILKNAIFEQSILNRVDFRFASSYTINPSINKIDEAYFSRTDIDGLLAHHNIKIE